MRFHILLLSLFVCLACTRALTHSRIVAVTANQYGTPIVDNSRPALSLRDVQPADAPEAVAATFRISPDKRVLAAVAHVYELSTGRSASQVEFDFRDGRWQIRCAGEEVGSLSELPTFAESLELLTRWSARLRSQRPAAAPASAASLQAIDHEIEAFTPPHLFNATALIAKNAAGRSLDGVSAARAADATTLLASQIVEWFEFGDPLRSRALALIAVARQIDPKCCANDVAVIANLLGYTKEAQTLAAGLPRASFAASYILGSSPEAKPTPSPAFSWLAKRAAIETQKSVRDLDPQFSPLLLMDHDFGEQVPASIVVTKFVLHEIGAQSSSETPLQNFDEALPAKIHALQNAVIDDVSVASYYESNFYSALLKQYFFYTTARAVADESRDFMESVGTPSRAASMQLVTWMHAYFDGYFGTATATRRPVDVLDKLTLLGGNAGFTLLQQYARVIGATQEATRLAAVALYAQLDSRPDQIYKAGQLSLHYILDPQHRDRYLTAALARMTKDPDANDTAWFYYLNANRDALRDMVEHSTDVEDRAEGLTYLAMLGGDAELVHRSFEENGLSSDSMNPLSQYAMYLNERGEAATKERFMRAWLAKWGDQTDPIMKAWVTSSLANALERQGKYREAWAVIEPEIPVYSGNVLQYAASILQRLGRTQEANDLAEKTIERYPGVGSRAAYAKLLWRENRFADAAALFDPKNVTYSVAEASSALPEEFVETFAKEKTPAEAVSALNELIKVGVNWQVADAIVAEAINKNHPDLAFALVEKLSAEPSRAPMNGRPESVTVLRNGYRALKALKGPEAATAWLQSRIPASAALQAVTVFYQTGDYDLVQRYAEVVSDQLKTPEAEAVHAAALLNVGAAQTDTRWQRLATKINQLPDKTVLPPIAKYLAGFVDERAFFAASTRIQNHPDAEYFAAVKAKASRDSARALPMMVAASFGPQDYPPAAWALSDLGRWAAERPLRTSSTAR